MHTYTPANSIFDRPITNLLSILCILAEVLSRAQAKRGKSLNHFKRGTSIGRFSSDSAASTAMNGLIHTLFPVRRPADLLGGLQQPVPGQDREVGHVRPQPAADLLGAERAFLWHGPVQQPALPLRLAVLRPVSSPQPHLPTPGIIRVILNNASNPSAILV